MCVQLQCTLYTVFGWLKFMSLFSFLTRQLTGRVARRCVSSCEWWDDPPAGQALEFMKKMPLSLSLFWFFSFKFIFFLFLFLFLGLRPLLGNFSSVLPILSIWIVEKHLCVTFFFLQFSQALFIMDPVKLHLSDRIQNRIPPFIPIGSAKILFSLKEQKNLKAAIILSRAPSVPVWSWGRTVCSGRAAPCCAWCACAASAHSAPRTWPRKRSSRTTADPPRPPRTPRIWAADRGICLSS